MRNSFAILAATMLSMACSPSDNPDSLAVYAITGCYFSDTAEPIQVLSYRVVTKEDIVLDSYEFLAPEGQDEVGAIEIPARSLAAFDPETGRFIKWIRGGRGLSRVGRMPFTRCGDEALCFAMPTTQYSPPAQYRRSECPASDQHGKPSL